MNSHQGMSLNLPDKKARIYLFGITIVLLAIVFRGILFQPNSYLFSNGGDGIKTYYGLSYYTKYGSGITFRGMNYPYGEHIVFTDNQPILAASLQWIEHHLFPVSDYSIGILNTLMIVSILLCIMVLYEILRHYMLPPWYAIFASLAIGFMSPQINRFDGHYALAYTSFVPVLWFLTIRLISSEYKKYLYSIFLTGWILIYSFITLYYGLLGAAFLVSFAFFHFIKHRKKSLPTIIWMVIATAVSIVVIKLFMGITDPVTDRVSVPYGFFRYRASFESIFLPSYGPIYEIIRNISGYTEAIGEGRAYVGLIGFMVLILTLFKLVRFAVRQKFKRILKPTLPHELGSFILASIPILLFSMTYPFRWNMQELFYSIPALSQFRAIGRLAWIFYYIFTVYAFFYIYQLFRSLRFRSNKKWALGLLCVLFGLAVAESHIHLDRKISPILQRKHSKGFLRKDYSNILTKNQLTPDDFQAIISFPYYSIGSEKLSFGGGKSLYESFKSSYDTGLPIAPVYMSRTSLRQAFLQSQMISGSLIKKEILNDYHNNKPLLLIVVQDDFTELEQDLVHKATYIGSCDKVKLYKLPLSAFEHTKPQAITQFLKTRNTLFQTPRYYCSDSTTSIVYKTFYQNDESGSFLDPFNTMVHSTEFELYNDVLPLDSNSDSIRFELSYWLYADQHTAGLPVLDLKQFENEEFVDQKWINGSSHSTETYHNWVRYTVPFTLFKPKNRISIFVRSRKIQINEVIIKPADANVYTHVAFDRSGKPVSLVKNNYELIP